MAKRRRCVDQNLPMLNLCLTLAEGSSGRLSEKIRRYAGQVAMIEVRLDFLDDLLIPELPLDRGTRFIATFRPRRQGGRFSGSEKVRLQVLQEAAHRGFQWVDLEVDAGEEPVLADGTATVRSLHLFEGFPKDLDSCLRELDQRGGDVLKLAVSVTSTPELCRLLLWMERLPPGLRRVVIGMNDMGQPSRVLGGFSGNAWTYVAEEDENTAAPGQFSLEEAQNTYRLDRLSAEPVLCAGLGGPVNQQRFVRLYNRLFAHYEQNALFVPVELDEVESWFDYVGESRLRFRGFAIGDRFRQDVESYLSLVGQSPIRSYVKEGAAWDAAAGPARGELVRYVAEQFGEWTGIDPDPAVLEEILDG
jgi:3-dehydroquinate dehydratase/shikimate dehydrogenase